MRVRPPYCAVNFNMSAFRFCRAGIATVLRERFPREFSRRRKLHGTRTVGPSWFPGIRFIIMREKRRGECHIAPARKEIPRRERHENNAIRARTLGGLSVNIFASNFADYTESSMADWATRGTILPRKFREGSWVIAVLNNRRDSRASAFARSASDNRPPTDSFSLIIERK